MEQARCSTCGGWLEPSPGAASLLDCCACQVTYVPSGCRELALLTRAGASSIRFVAGIPLSDQFLAEYRPESLLGAGAMGTVYRTTRRSDGLPVAIKFLLRVDEPELRARFLREGELSRRVQHPAVVRVHASGEIAGHPYLVFDLVDGGTLLELLRTSGRLAAQEAVRIGLDVLAGLAACHEQGIVHRDVKPANILLTVDGAARLADLGIARDCDAQEALTRAGTVLGTPIYMSPEQLTGEAVGPASDLYSVSVMLHELIAGHPPFSSPSLELLVKQHLSSEPPPLAGVPEDLARLVLRGLSKLPAGRPASALEMAQSLAECTGRRPQSRGQPSRPSSQPRRASRPEQPVVPGLGISASNSAPAALPSRVVAVLVIVTALLGGTHLFLRRATPPLAGASGAQGEVLAEFRDPARPPTLAAEAPPTPSDSRPPSTLEEEAARLFRLAEAESAVLEPWPASGGGGESTCAVVLIHPAHVRTVRLELEPECTVLTVNGRPALVDAGREVTLPALGLTAGINWLSVRHASGLRPAPGRIAFVRSACPGDLDRQGGAADWRLYDVVHATARKQFLELSVNPTRALLAQRIPDSGDPVRRWLAARLDLLEADWFASVSRSAGQLDDDDPPFVDGDVRERARAALELCQAVLATSPGRWDAWQDAGSVLWRAGQISAARAALAQALSIRPDADWTWRELGRLERRLHSERARGGAHDAAASRRHALAALKYLDWARTCFARRTPPVDWMVADLDGMRRELSGPPRRTR